jgi:hypothetical protein
MAETKRVSDQYKITAPAIIIDGNLTVMGTTTSVETVNSVIQDNIIVLNKAEVGAGVTAGTAGIEIERGSSTNSTFLYNESNDAWEAKIGASYTTIRAATPVNPDDLVTKDYVDSGLFSTSPGGPLYAVQFNNTPIGLGGDGNFLYDGSVVTIFDITIGDNFINNNATNADLELAANGTGTIYLQSVVKLDNQLSDPTATSATNKLYAKTPSNAGSGLFFVNTTASDELVSKSKAILFGLIF